METTYIPAHTVLSASDTTVSQAALSKPLEAVAVEAEYVVLAHCR